MLKKNRGTKAPGISPLEYARKHSITLDWTYKLIRMGKLPAVNRFGRLFITGEAVHEHKQS